MTQKKQKKTGFLSTRRGPRLLSKSLQISSSFEQSQLTVKNKIVWKSLKTNGNDKLAIAKILGDMCSKTEAPMMNTEWKICGMGYWKGGNKKRQIDGCSNMKQYVCE